MTNGVANNSSRPGSLFVFVGEIFVAIVFSMITRFVLTPLVGLVVSLGALVFGAEPVLADDGLVTPKVKSQLLFDRLWEEQQAQASKGLEKRKNKERAKRLLCERLSVNTKLKTYLREIVGVKLKSNPKSILVESVQYQNVTSLYGVCSVILYTPVGPCFFDASPGKPMNISSIEINNRKQSDDCKNN